MPRRNDFSDDSVYNAWVVRFSDSIDKKFYPQGTGVYLLRKRTANIAVSVADKLRKLSAAEVRLNLRVYDDGGEVASPLIREYENELIRAREYPASFADNLYSFYTSSARRIKEDDNSDLFFGLLAFVEDRVFTDQSGSDFTVFSAFMDLLSQQMEFLRKEPLDCLKILAGMTTDGETIETDDPYPAIDWPLYKLVMLSKHGARPDIAGFLESEYKKLGFDGIQTIEDYELLNGQSRLFIANVNSMSSFVNEYTSDILPQSPLKVGRRAMHAPALKSPEKYKYLLNLAKHRKRTLPLSGIRVDFTGSSFYTALTVKEIFRFGDLYMLFKLSTVKGDISGRYNTRTGSLITPLNSAVPRPDDFIENINGFVLWAYTAATCEDELVQPTNSSYHDIIDDEGAVIEFVSLGNRLYRTYGANPDYARVLDLEKYESKEISLNGYIRRLPEGQKASEKARALALSAGLDLDENETYVRPFTRHSWMLRQAKKEDSENE